MKIEVGESLACSYLRHVKGCWLVQTNWKTPEHWGERQPDAVRFSDLKRRFDRDGAVFKKTKDAAQFLKQGEIDVVGVDLQGNVHAMEVAFHEAGLNYGHTADETYNRVLKKMLRVVFILNRLIHPPQTALHAYFLSPKVNPAVEGRLKEMFNDLLPREPGVVWQLMINADCTESVVKPTLESASSVADSSELFLRSVKLLETANGLRTRDPDTPAQTSARRPGSEVKFQPLVKALMQTLLEEYPALLGDTEKCNLQDKAHCKNKNGLGLQISNFGLIRKKQLGPHQRYWKKPYGDFYVCSEWWPAHHRANAKALLSFVEELARTKPDHADALHPHVRDFRQYLSETAS